MLLLSSWFSYLLDGGLGSIVLDAVVVVSWRNFVDYHYDLLVFSTRTTDLEPEAINASHTSAWNNSV